MPRAHYQEHGYVVCRGLVPRELCERVRAAFASEVKPYRGFLYRQASANPERHVLTSHGHVLNALLNLQDLRDDLFPELKRLSLEVLTHPRVQAAGEVVLGEPGKLVQSMYFEGNPATWAHQDTYYLDARELGRMTGAWFALEEIHPGAGRFFVYPGSHRIDMTRNAGDVGIAYHHDRYKALVLRVIREHGLRREAPALEAGDVLFWSSKTIHGSLETTEPGRSRSSLTCHLIPRSQDFLRWQAQTVRLRLRNINGLPVHCPKDQNEPLDRAVFFVATRFPRLFQAAKKVATRLVVR